MAFGNIIRGVGISTIATAAVMASGATANAAGDIGDGSLACNIGEICFARDAGNNGGFKHFWKEANHSGLSWSNGGPVQDNASYGWNRDTDCTVTVYNYVGNVGYFFELKKGQALNFTGDQNDTNDGHSRC